MKRIILALTLALGLAGCTGTVAKFQQIYAVASSSTVDPSFAIITANAFDGFKGGATQYLIYCKTNLATPACSAANRRSVIKYTRDGTVVRNQIEGYITTATPIPSAVYNILVAAVNGLSVSPAASFGAPK
jgi:hypothetical protein